MSNDTIILDEILYKNQAPWLAENASNEKFVSKIHEVKEHVPAFQFKNTIEFERSINAKTKYYSKLIINESIATINQLHGIIATDDNSQIRAYWIDKVLERKLKTRIRDIGKVLKDKDYDLKYIDPKKTSFDLDQNHKSNTYIMQLMKVAFIHIYVELQEVFKDSISDLLILDDFYTQLLFEPVPDKIYLKEAQVIAIPSESRKAIKKEENGFEPILGEVPNCKISKANYDIIRNQTLFSNIERNLHEYELIDIDYNFIKNKKESNSRNLAAIVQILIDKNYFRRNILGSSDQYKDIDIREYIENRYNTDLKQQFRRLTSEQKVAALTKYHWLDKLTALR